MDTSRLNPATASDQSSTSRKFDIERIIVTTGLVILFVSGLFFLNGSF